ncbi:P-loop NTPase [Parasphingorhabdus halotolerans]|uniref:P-loop NTPase n=1 Tax=Parasphingorhabdus halotolerans TaxID=2725558 RepID=A0A6H2DM66_9SPHN|nr:P-loop NTPase [Parasphingorhabdus halotolerans]
MTKVEGLELESSGRDVEFYQTQYSLLSARTLAERVARQLKLAKSEAFFAAHGLDNGDGLLNSTDSLGTLSKKELDKREKLAVGFLLANVSISPIRGSALVDVSYTSSSPKISADISNTWTQQFIEQSMARRFASTADARKFLEGRLEELRMRLETSERDLVNYASAKDIVSLNRERDTDGKTTSERTLITAELEGLNKELADATADRIASESRLNAKANRELTPDPLIINGASAQLRQKRAELRAEMAKLMVQFEPEYPSVKVLAEEIRVLDDGIAKEEGRLTNREAARASNNRITDYRAALNRESGLTRRVNTLKKRFSQQQRDIIQYNIYLREVDNNRQLYDAILQRYKEIGVAGIGSNNVAIVDVANIPNSPSSPNLPFNLVLSLMLGLGLSVVVVVGLDQIEEGLRDPSQVNRLLHLPLLGGVPSIPPENIQEMMSDTKSVLSEAYFTVRSNLAFSTDHGVPRTFMVTSTRSAEGKSTSSTVLATILARTGKKVLLLDADMRSPSINGLFGLQNDRGLSNYLAGEDDWQNLLIPTTNDFVTILPAGPAPLVRQSY